MTESESVDTHTAEPNLGGDAKSSPLQPSLPTEAAASNPVEEEEDDEEEEEDEAMDSCGFCKFMRGGGCRKAFNAWSKCVDKERDDGADFASRCGAQTIALRECMLAHRDYYAPLLEEEEEAARQAQEQDAAFQEMQAEREKQQAAAASGLMQKENLEAEKPGVGV